MNNRHSATTARVVEGCLKQSVVEVIETAGKKKREVVRGEEKNMLNKKKRSRRETTMEEDDVVHVKVYDEGGVVLFDGKVSAYVTTRELSHLRCFSERYLRSFLDKATNKGVRSFRGMQNVELIASYGIVPSFSGVLYRCNDGVLRSSKTVPSCECVMMSVWDISDILCGKVFNCETLEDLDINECKLRQIPNDIGKMKMLKNLRLYGLKELESIPEEIGEIYGLKELSIWVCGIKSLPTSIGRLKQLELLTFKYCEELKNVPETLGELSSLKKLSIGECAIESLQKSIEGLKQLEEMNLESLKYLKSIPEEIGCLSKLRKLEICYCNIVSLPKSMKELKQLSYVRLINLEELQLDPEILFVFSRLTGLTVWGCGKLFQGNGVIAFCQMLKMSASLREVTVFWGKLKSEMFREALLENGSITKAEGYVVSDFSHIFARNRSNHARAKRSVVCMIAIRRFRRGLSGVPREIIDMLAKMLWITRCDVDAWMIKERSEKRQRK